eukprot:jgi/Botrbrau1/6969/Bobra.0165s0007.1
MLTNNAPATPPVSGSPVVAVLLDCINENAASTGTTCMFANAGATHTFQSYVDEGTYLKHHTSKYYASTGYPHPPAGPVLAACDTITGSSCKYLAALACKIWACT